MLVKILLLVLGIVLGFLVSCWSVGNQKIGILRRLIDPEDGVYFYLELEKEKVTRLENGRFIVLEVRDDDRVIKFPQK